VTNILEAPGEVVGKSGHSTLYRASIPVDPAGTSAVSALLRFVRPGCAGRSEEIVPIVRMLGTIRHPNLVPLRALYVGPRGEKLLVHPFYAAGTLDRFLRGVCFSCHLIWILSQGNCYFLPCYQA
jgi:hypothetical protein